LTAQLYSPVRWIESVSAMAAAGVNTFIEIGPGKVLSGMNSRIATGARTFSTPSAAELEAALAAVK
jgi:[acyl-carrier-protein] S-malonyltransferase